MGFQAVIKSAASAASRKKNQKNRGCSEALPQQPGLSRTPRETPWTTARNADGGSPTNPYREAALAADLLANSRTAFPFRGDVFGVELRASPRSCLWKATPSGRSGLAFAHVNWVILGSGPQKCTQLFLGPQYSDWKN